MHTRTFFTASLFLGCLAGVIDSHAAGAQTPPASGVPSPGVAPAPAAQARSGQHDFDFEFGRWTTRLRRLVKPLTGSTTWVEYEGMTVVRPVLDGRANIVELVVDGPAGRIEGLSLRLYDPVARQWSLNFSSPASGTLTPPVIGEFKNGRGEFFGTDTVNGRTVLVRFVITNVSPKSWRFEQAYSEDAGKTWEVNWIVVDTKVEGELR